MSEEQGKSKRWYKNWWNYLFILIFTLFIAALWVMSIGGSGPPSNRTYVYGTIKAQLQNAVQDYQDKNEGGFPTVNENVTVNGSLYHIIDICALLVSRGRKLSYTPDNCVSINGSDNDNCDGGCEGCWEYSHYIWAVDESGNVYSTCIGSDCNANNTDGYQGVWP